jgi:TetR/AcrR family transcriptional repressor of nem operon
MSTKETILDCAQTLVLEKGFTATSLDEICAKAGITKGGFFHYFKNKEQLGAEMVDRYAQRAGEAIMSCVSCCGADPLDRVLGYIDATSRMCLDPANKGCLIGTMTQELHESHPLISCCCGEKFLEMRDTLHRDLVAAAAVYEMDQSVDLAGLAEMFISTLQGGFILAKATKDRQAIVRVMSHYRSYVKSLFKK